MDVYVDEPGAYHAARGVDHGGARPFRPAASDIGDDPVLYCDRAFFYDVIGGDDCAAPDDRLTH